MVSLSYNDANNTLTVIIVKARNLKAKDINGLSGNLDIIVIEQKFCCSLNINGLPN